MTALGRVLCLQAAAVSLLALACMFLNRPADPR